MYMPSWLCICSYTVGWILTCLELFRLLPFSAAITGGHSNEFCSLTRGELTNELASLSQYKSNLLMLTGAQ